MRTRGQIQGATAVHKVLLLSSGSLEEESQLQESRGRIRMASPSPPLMKQFTNYTNSAPGLENLLRFVQYVCQVVEAVSISPVAAQPWSVAWKHIALG